MRGFAPRPAQFRLQFRLHFQLGFRLHWAKFLWTELANNSFYMLLLMRFYYLFLFLTFIASGVHFCREYYVFERFWKQIASTAQFLHAFLHMRSFVLSCPVASWSKFLFCKEYHVFDRFWRPSARNHQFLHAFFTFGIRRRQIEVTQSNP